MYKEKDMKILNITSEFVEIFWVDDNEIEIISIEEFKTKYPNHPLNQ